ncbi:MAG: hypothetical protein KDD73_13415 [Anaerolineales bacterium]|nr:hypothetical protein [Anaerolineales bacterium]
MSSPHPVRRLGQALLLAALLWGVGASRAWAAAPHVPNDDGWSAIADWWAAQLNNFFIEVMRAATTALWLLEQVAAGIMRFLTEEDLWGLLLENTLGTLRDTMPDLLQGLIFAGDGAGGLLYLALMLAGIFLILPNLSHARPVEGARVLIWAVVIATLFISSLVGYDLVGYIEQVRQGATTLVVEAIDDGGAQLDDIVRVPMYATAEEMGQYTFQLPAQFEMHYFPAPDEAAFEERYITFIDSPFFTWQMTLRVESSANQEERRQKGQTGIAVGGLVLVPAAVLLLFGIVYATLAAAALVLIVFFLVALPLGFFEFGGAILRGITKQYMYLFAITLLAVTLAGILVASGLLDVSSVAPPDNPAHLMTLVPIFLIVVIALSYVSLMAKEAMLDTFGVVATSIRTSFAPLSYAGGVPSGGGLIQSAGSMGGDITRAATGAVSSATGAALTAAGSSGVALATTGATTAALAAGAGSLLHSLDDKLGYGASRMAIAAGGTGMTSNVFAAAARGRPISGVAAHGLRARRKDRAAATTQYEQGSDQSRRAPYDNSRGNRPAEAGPYQTLDVNELDRANEAYTAGEHVVARRMLERTFGSREIAADVLDLYQEEGAAGMQRVRQTVTTTQQSAGDVAQSGRPLFNNKGQASDMLNAHSWQALKRAGVVKSRNATDAALVGRIAGASVRRTSSLWADPAAAQRLAEATGGPDGTHPELQVGDLSAQYALRQLAHQSGWTTAHLEGLFGAVGTSYARTGGQRVPYSELLAQVSQSVGTQGEWRQVPAAQRREASRLALLIAEQATQQQAVTMGRPPQEAKIPDAPSGVIETPVLEPHPDPMASASPVPSPKVPPVVETPVSEPHSGLEAPTRPMPSTAPPIPNPTEETPS